MTKRKEGRIFPREDIKEPIVLIKDSTTDYIAESGNIYKHIGCNEFIKKTSRVNPHGYVDCGITYTIDGVFKNKRKRVHRLLATAFIDNPNNYEVVGHLDNNKSNNAISNLYWTTISENTQKAVDDGLLINAKGFEDSQSKPVDVYIDGVFSKSYGSAEICAKETGIPKSTILFRCNGMVKTSIRKHKNYTFKFHGQPLTTIENVGDKPSK